MAGDMSFAERVALGMKGDYRSEDNKARISIAIQLRR